MSQARPLAAARALKHQGLLARRRVGAVMASALLRWRHRETFRAVRESMRLPSLDGASAGAIWGISMVKDEADVIERSVTQLLAEGVDGVLVVDNGSTDGTLEILRDLERTHPVHVGMDPMAAYEQSVKMTVLADAVSRAGASWVIPFDADELWTGLHGSVKESLQSCRSPVALAHLVNAFPSPQGEGQWRLDPLRHYDPKVAFRPFRGAVIQMGNHGVDRPGEPEPCLQILHLPWRSFEQFARKVQQGASALRAADLPPEKGSHWRDLGALSPAELRMHWDALLRGEALPGNPWAPRSDLVPITLAQPMNGEDLEAARGAPPR